jgi:hypothetical protein
MSLAEIEKAVDEIGGLRHFTAIRSLGSRKLRKISPREESTKRRSRKSTLKLIQATLVS